MDMNLRFSQNLVIFGPPTFRLCFWVLITSHGSTKHSLKHFELDFLCINTGVDISIAVLTQGGVTVQGTLSFTNKLFFLAKGCYWFI